MARVVKTQGRRGEVAAELFTDFPERFEQRRKLSALMPKGERRELALEEFWPHKGRVVLKFQGVDSISDAEMLIGAQIQIRREERAELEPGAAFIADLVGCVLEDVRTGTDVGIIDGVATGAGEAPLLVVNAGTKEILVPFAAEYLRLMDVTGRKKLVMELPEGMLELDKPLTAEEKEEQGGRK